MILLLSENGIYEKKWGGSFYYKDEENKEVEVPFKHGRLICFKGGVILQMFLVILFVGAIVLINVYIIY